MYNLYNIMYKPESLPRINNHSITLRLLDSTSAQDDAKLEIKIKKDE